MFFLLSVLCTSKSVMSNNRLFACVTLSSHSQAKSLQEMCVLYFHPNMPPEATYTYHYVSYPLSFQLEIRFDNGKIYVSSIKTPIYHFCMWKPYTVYEHAPTIFWYTGTALPLKLYFIIFCESHIEPL